MTGSAANLRHSANSNARCNAVATIGLYFETLGERSVKVMTADKE
jgi:hypothetical protein